MNLALARRAPQWAALAIAALAAVLLAGTVAVASRGVDQAAATLTRGEGEALVRAIEDDLGREGPPTEEDLARQIGKRRAAGLRYLALVEPDVGRVVEAGESLVRSHDPPQPGHLELREGLARLVQPMLPPGRPDDRAGPRPGPPPGRGPHRPPPPPFGDEPVDGPPPRSAHPPLMVIEYEPLLVGDLASSMAMARAVAALAVTVLVILAVVLGRRIARAAEEERRGERERRLVALGGMSAVMAHELRNPLASLKGHAQLLVENLAPGSRDRAKAELVVSEARRMERLTHALLEFVRDAPLERREVAVDDLLARSLEPFPTERLEVVREGGPPRASVDEARLAMAIGNLVRNALESAPEGKVEVRVAGTASELHIDVRDHGPGLPEAEGERIFEPFVTTRVKGTGLGLAVARRAVEQHGGTLVGENADGGGARFRIVLAPDAPPP